MVKDSSKSVRIHVFIYRLPHLKSRMNGLANGFPSLRGARRKLIVGGGSRIDLYSIRVTATRSPPKFPLNLLPRARSSIAIERRQRINA